jgi:uncharacterized membrane protein YdbT with pleckstrin-like domain
MAYPDHLLSRGERVVLHKHPHWKILVLPIIALVLIIGLASFGSSYAYRHTGNYRIWWIVAAAVAIILLVFLCVVPFIKWRSEHFVISTRHVFFRTGFFKRREHQIPLDRIQNLETAVSFWGRIFGYGTLTIESAADQPLSFLNVASLPKVQSELNQLIHDDRNSGPQADQDSAAAQSAAPAGTRADNRPTRVVGERQSTAVDEADYGREYDPEEYDAPAPQLPPNDTATRRLPTANPDKRGNQRDVN